MDTIVFIEFVIISLFVGFIILGLVFELVGRLTRYARGTLINKAVASPGILSEESLALPGGLYFDKTHTWAFMENDGEVKVGLDDFLTRVTGKLTGIRLRNAGESFKKSEIFMSVLQNGKQLDLRAPVSGIIKEQNTALFENASLINSFPYTAGWVYKVQPTNWMREIQFLFMAGKFGLWLKEEFARLKDFICTAQLKSGAPARIVLQDGGEIKEGALMNFRSEIWEDFQTNFIDAVK